MIRAKNLPDLQTKLTVALDAKAGQVASGALSPADFVVEAENLLSLSHSRAAFLGSARAKRGGNVDVAIRVAARASDEQRSFILKFAEDLAAGKYKPKAQGGRGARQRMGRFALYSMRLVGTANESWAETLIQEDRGVEGLWRLGSPKEHCPDCRAESLQGWRPLLRFRFFPGQARTKCLLRCGCSVTTRDGKESYAL